MNLSPVLSPSEAGDCDTRGGCARTNSSTSWKSATNTSNPQARLFLLSVGRKLLLISNLVYKLVYGLIIGLTVGLIGGGGKACIQHFALRVILYGKGCIPWNYARFLDYATDRIFLQKVGGGYIFIHRLLLEHFAQMKLEG